jgi:hypothetical protein
MRVREFGVALVLFVAALAVGASAEQTPAPPAPSGPPTQSVQERIVGTWRIDRQQPLDGQEAWRRRIDALELSQSIGPSQQPAPGRPYDPNAGMPLISGSGLEMAAVRTAMRDLLEIAERLSFHVAADTVTITDDLDRALKFSTRGAKDKRLLAATEFTAKTQWTDRVLTQEISAWTFRMTEMFLPSNDGQELLILIKIQKPTFSPPIKDMTRMYVKVK